ncbi:MAG: acyl-CoA-binding protein [Gammaproteobacteria bacterium SG8_31]|jgi:acyl-CoA-binding protein|nr:MAG: acyl-CoA-binding protein [Gammaproteobacteria bacterium SG8_31]
MSGDLKAQFEQAAKDVKGLTSRPSDEDLLSLYALYKQATEGDAKGEKPGLFNFVARAKFEAWEELAGTSSEAAMREYIDKVKALGA